MKRTVFWVVVPCSLVEVSWPASTSETSVNFYHTARRNNPEDSHLHVQRDFYKAQHDIGKEIKKQNDGIRKKKVKTFQ
jgi:hypothetical protein